MGGDGVPADVERQIGEAVTAGDLERSLGPAVAVALGSARHGRLPRDPPRHPAVALDNHCRSSR